MVATKPTVRVIGLGNAYRGDDAIGLEVAQAVGVRLPDVDVVAGIADGTALLELWDKTELCVVVDCAVSGAAPGTVHCFDGLTQQIPERLFSSFSTHAFSIPSAIELGRVLNRLPGQLLVCAVEGNSFACGVGMAEPVRRSAAHLIDRIVSVIEDYRKSHVLN